MLICCVWFSPNVALCIHLKHLHFGLVSPKDIVPEVLSFVQMQLCKRKPCCHDLFREKRLSPSHLFTEAIRFLGSYALHDMKYPFESRCDSE